MALILNIDTATPVCSVALARNGKLLALREKNEKNIHAEILTQFIMEVIAEAECSLADLDAVAVSKGPGSYTGLRIGVSTAKGLCYSLDIPLIGIGTIDSMAHFAAQELQGKFNEQDLFLPTIDARRMEIYGAFYNHKLEAQTEVKPHILDENSFSEEGENKKIILTGDGAAKCQEIFKERDEIKIYPDIHCSSQGMIQLSEEAFNKQNFEDVAYFEPFYLKEFIAGIPKVKGLR
ncbi:MULTISPECIES: tRNA (adenosine(37)-N6)-threonylcarbamoyltransferase complex dimerization subunit type 1 TsaB [unclassified Lentimicrobium]|uniref:tRNA (adenosine(37)-N6)-threonylcarbamoyltransferase complex dimerization subunit type 1 TsaB n=1 Tax=unclassified Lentimicrobium TaxID=2677434 RepID=UPI001556201D|nr:MULTISPECIES: tRNA (adenosine(37)-N6)-threonylcarbamoyltransferase complex dimerization subunit type 1 TsaB [unclassified Lentimicrobium]NPD47049.1 tRNA (adenosine(37)-N6)-threonylcarbamoyltransferase complex dimerization subunit type 1 TsaB [Lentimicrobium sp. S6]NPD86023.1 tRNA (adenosine(37)-N6)-threonylcarbamoyltransferase complex dimerization subunit type 1 TsaB [Lentimicrobium sp. L6]